MASMKSAFGAVVCSSVVLGACSLARAGFAVNHMDIAPRYAGIVMGVSNTAGTVAGVVGVAATGQILEASVAGATDLKNWAVVFSVPAFLSVLSAVIFLVFATGERRFDAPQRFERNSYRLQACNIFFRVIVRHELGLNLVTGPRKERFCIQYESNWVIIIDSIADDRATLSGVLEPCSAAYYFGFGVGVRAVKVTCPWYFSYDTRHKSLNFDFYRPNKVDEEKMMKAYDEALGLSSYVVFSF
ncbi:hypothetical protein R1flu_009173 [Riccia fluitans]|uniref:Uncharacterized protein n=1 Tax=Riccia fluitans TaxID=41844 RepID=A0ABD1Z1C5_9MARC